MAIKSVISFSEVLDSLDLKEVPAREKEAPAPMSPQNDSLNLSVQAMRGMTKKADRKEPSAPKSSLRRDQQGNRVEVSRLGASMAKPASVAWETGYRPPKEE